MAGKQPAVVTCNFFICRKERLAWSGRSRCLKQVLCEEKSTKKTLTESANRIRKSGLKFYARFLVKGVK